MGCPATEGGWRCIELERGGWQGQQLMQWAFAAGFEVTVGRNPYVSSKLTFSGVGEAENVTFANSSLHPPTLCSRVSLLDDITFVDWYTFGYGRFPFFDAPLSVRR